jgi:hypothetical protein
MAKRLIVGAYRYNFKDKDSDRQIAGVSVQILEPVQADSENNRKGFSPIKVNAPLLVWSDLTELPAFYETSENLRINAQGKAEMSFSGVKFLSGVDVEFVSQIS